MQMKGKVAVVTGASMGIGEAIARRFVQEGACVALSSRDLGRTEAARARIGVFDRTLAIACDVSRRSDLEHLRDATLRHFGRLDVWVNNAGYGLSDSVADMDMGQCRAMFDTNLFGAIEGMQVAIPVMRKQGSGAIINISSVAGHLPLPGKAAYSASKFAMNAIGKAAGMELAGTGINVLTVCPGYIDTNFAENTVKGRSPLRLGSDPRTGATAELVAKATLDGYLKRKCEVVVPRSNSLFVLIYQLIPRLVERTMIRMLQPGSAASDPARAASRS